MAQKENHSTTGILDKTVDSRVQLADLVLGGGSLKGVLPINQEVREIVQNCLGILLCKKTILDSVDTDTGR